MWGDLKKKILKKVMVRLIVCAIFIGLIVSVLLPSIQYMLKGPEELNVVAPEDLDGAYVTNEFSEIYDYFAEYYETEGSGYENVTDRYYLVPYGENMVIGMELGGEDFAVADQIIDEVNGYTDYLGTSIQVTGTIAPMTETIYNYYINYFAEAGFTEEELEGWALPYVLHSNYTGEVENYVVYLGIGAVIVLILIALIIVMKLITGVYLSKIRKMIKNGTSAVEEYMDRDYQAAMTIERVKVGKIYTFFFKGIKVDLVKNEEIVWAYNQEITHRVNGIKAGVTKSLVMFTKDKKKYKLDMKKKESVLQALYALKEINQGIVLGYSDELKQCFDRDFQKFLTLKGTDDMNC